MSRLGRQQMVPFVEQVADGPAQEPTPDEAGCDPSAAGARDAHDEATHRRAAEGADRGLGRLAHLRTLSERLSPRLRAASSLWSRPTRARHSGGENFRKGGGPAAPLLIVALRGG
jgi:hypothetical protein